MKLKIIANQKGFIMSVKQSFSLFLLIFFSIALMTSFSLAAPSEINNGERTILNLNGHWDFTYTYSSVKQIPDIPDANAFDCKIKVPGGWDEQLESFEKAAWRTNAQFITTIKPVKYLAGIGWYRRTIQAPMEWKHRVIRLTVGSSIGACNVWLNGKHVASYDYGVYTPFEIDLTNVLKLGSNNELIISVDNTRLWSEIWAFYEDKGQASGITRPITIEIAAGPGIINDLYLRPGDDLKEVVWQLELHKQNQQQGDSTIYWEILDNEKKNILSDGHIDVNDFNRTKQIIWKTRINSLKPWSPEDPQLYWAIITWKNVDGKEIDCYQQRFGMRRWSISGRKLYLNGKQMYMRGEFSALTFPLTGIVETSKEFWINHIKQAKAVGMNYINFAARVPPIEMMEAADELGMIIQTGDHMTVLKEFRQYYEEVWQPIVRVTRRYPSVGIYGFGGERNYYGGIIEQFQKQYDLIKALHPECLVMPQQAIRGIDYNFAKSIENELTLKPFPHHAERLTQYTKACDLFGHYSGQAFGYDYFNTPWQEMEQRFKIYEKPLIMHELFMGSSYLNPDNIAKYTGKYMRPYQYFELEKNLKQAGLEDRWHTYWLNSCYLQHICKKYCVEKLRKCNDQAGFEYLGLIDENTMWYYCSGILDEFLELKPGDSFENIRRYMDESVLLIDFSDITKGSINRSYWSGDQFFADIMVSLFGAKPIEKGKLTWELKSDNKILLNDNADLKNIANGCVSTIHKLNILWPNVQKTTRMNLSFRLEGNDYKLANDWDFWVFPKTKAPAEIAVADENSIKLLSERYNVKPLAQAQSARLRIVSQITAEEVDYLVNGGSVLLLGTAPFERYDKSTGFRSGLALRKWHNVGSVIQRHPIFAFLPHEGWGDWQFYPVIEGSPCIILPVDMNTPFDPILEFISQPGEVRRQAAILEKKIGEGRLLISTCVYDQNNPSCVALMDGIIEYMQSSKYEPASELPIAVLLELIDPSYNTASFGNDETSTSVRSDRPEKNWYNKAVTIKIPNGGSVSINNGKFEQMQEVTISSEGITKLLIKKNDIAGSEIQPEIKEVYIDTTPPKISLSTDPVLEQEGGIYFGKEKTLFKINGVDVLSGIRTIEISVDGGEYIPYTKPFQVPVGQHELRCRAVDNAGNVSELMGGDILSGGSTRVVVFSIRNN